jgi:hypothetical protein
MSSLSGSDGVGSSMSGSVGGGSETDVGCSGSLLQTCVTTCSMISATLLLLFALELIEWACSVTCVLGDLGVEVM